MSIKLHLQAPELLYRVQHNSFEIMPAPIW